MRFGTVVSMIRGRLMRFTSEGLSEVLWYWVDELHLRISCRTEWHGDNGRHKEGKGCEESSSQDSTFLQRMGLIVSRGRHQASI